MTAGLTAHVGCSLKDLGAHRCDEEVWSSQAPGFFFPQAQPLVQGPACIVHQGGAPQPRIPLPEFFESLGGLVIPKHGVVKVTDQHESLSPDLMQLAKLHTVAAGALGYIILICVHGSASLQCGRAEGMGTAIVLDDSRQIS